MAEPSDPPKRDEHFRNEHAQNGQPGRVVRTFGTKWKWNVIVIFHNLSFQLLSPKSTKKINAVHERSLRIILNDYESPYSLLLEEAHQITFHQWCIISLMIKVYTYLSEHSPGIMNYIFKLREIMYNIWNVHIFQTENPLSLKYGLDAVPY